MEITSFVLGMLTIIGMAAAVLIVLGIVKIYKQAKKVEQLEALMYREIEHLYKNTNDYDMQLQEQLNRLSRDLDQRIDRIEEHFFNSMGDEKREIISYVDSRIDKLQSKKEANK